MRNPTILSFAAWFLLMFAGAVSAETEYDQHRSHVHATKPQTGAQPLEPGQGAFAAIAEIVEILQNDPHTDWASVNITALREHLVDMNNLTLNADVVEIVNGTSVTFVVTGDGNTLRAIQTMAPAHSAELNSATDWTVTAKINDNGAEMRLTAPDETGLQQIRSLGFFGVMATGAHHQAHHLQIAKGRAHSE